MFIDWSYIVFVLPAVVFALITNFAVKNTFSKYQNQKNSKGITAVQAARTVLDANGLTDVRIENVHGELTDHFDPKSNVIRLSDSVYSSTSTAAIGVACHEVGHAIQYAKKYVPVKIRTAIVPVTNIGSMLSVPLIILGAVLSAFMPMLGYLVYVGIGCFALSTVFQLVTLPTEFNASTRALKALKANNIIW